MVSSRNDAFLSKKLATIELNVELDNFEIENYLFKPDSILNQDIIEFFEKYEFNLLSK